MSGEIPFQQENNFNNRLLERQLTQTTDFVCLSIRTHGQTKNTKDRYLMSYLSNKKRILKIGPLELILEGGVRTDGRTYGWTDISPMSKPTFHFFNSFELKKGK